MFWKKTRDWTEDLSRMAAEERGPEPSAGARKAAWIYDTNVAINRVNAETRERAKWVFARLDTLADRAGKPVADLLPPARGILRRALHFFDVGRAGHELECDLRRQERARLMRNFLGVAGAIVREQVDPRGVVMLAAWRGDGVPDTDPQW